MSEQLKQLQELLAQLHEVNQEFARAARPLDRMTDLNEEQQKAVRAPLLAAWARWESVTQRISQALEIASARGVSPQDTSKADRNENL